MGGLSCGNLMAVAMIVFACTVIVLSSATTYNNWKVSTRRVNDGQRVKAMRDRDPHICSIDYMMEGCNRGVMESAKQPFVDAVVQTIVDSMPYKIYNIHPHYVWWALFALIILWTLSEYKLRSERVISQNMAANGMAVMNAAAAAMARPVAAPAIDETTLQAAVGKALRQQTRQESRAHRQQQQQPQQQPRFVDQPLSSPTTTTKLPTASTSDAGDHISATQHARKTATSLAINVSRSHPGMGGLANEVDA